MAVDIASFEMDCLNLLVATYIFIFYNLHTLFVESHVLSLHYV